MIKDGNTEKITTEEKVVGGLKDKNLGDGVSNDLGKTRGYLPKKKTEKLKTTARYDKFRAEFKDIYDEINEKNAL